MHHDHYLLGYIEDGSEEVAENILLINQMGVHIMSHKS